MSTDTTTEETSKRKTYGPLRKTGMPGVWGLPPAFLGMLAVLAVLLVVLVMGQQWFPALGVVLVAGVLTGIMLKPSSTGLNTYERQARKQAGRLRRISHKNVLLQGPVGRTPDGKCRLPGLAAQMELTEWADPLGRTFAMLTMPSTKHHTIVLKCQAAGTAGLDQGVLDQMVSHWSEWLGSLGETGSIVAASAVIESAPGTRQQVEQDVLSDLDPSAPQGAVAAVRDTVASLAGAPTISTWLTVTFTGEPKVQDVKPRTYTTKEMAEEISARLPALLGGLAGSGAGDAVEPCTGQELVDAVRTAFDPSAADDIAEAQVKDGGTGLTWNDAGPVSHHAGEDTYKHEGAFSRTWYLFKPPRRVVVENILEPLLAPHGAVARKRVAILYRPSSPAESAAQVDRDVRNANWAMSMRKRITPGAAKEKALAEQAEREEDQGATLVRMGIVVTATAHTRDELDVASAAVMSQLSAPKRLYLRIARDAQDVAFTAALPIGLVLPAHMVVPQQIREAM